MSTAPFKVKALFEYHSGHEDDLPFSIGQIITVTDEDDADWYGGEYVDDSGTKQEGIFPRNFVEKYEPVAPPRPTRTRTRKEAEVEHAPAPAPSVQETPAAPPEPDYETAVEIPQTESPAPATEPFASPPVSEAPKRASIALVAPPPEPLPRAIPAPAPIARAEPAQARPSPPPVSEKPSSFRDRIAAFNKAAAPPIAPFKPSGLGSGGASNFIKKPFVAPPPSRNAYILPPSRDVPQAKVYRREEDPEIREQQAETQESAERAGLVPSSHGAEGGDAEEQPKPTSLKERIALLQKQQMEQAQRHAEAASKKEKPKRPPKKRTESHEAVEEGEAAPAHIPPPLERRDTEGTEGRGSLDESHPPRVPHPARRRSLKATETQDGNEADMSGAGDTTEGQEEDLTEKEDSDEKYARASLEHAEENTNEELEGDEGQEEEEQEEEEEDVDPEVRRREELRARMAKMSGGMGMHGMFGPPSMMPLPGAAPAPPKKKSVPEKQGSQHSEDSYSPAIHAPPIPIMALPGMSARRSEERTPVQESVVGSPPKIEEEEASEPEEIYHPRKSVSLESGQPSGPPPIPSREPAGPPPIPGSRPAPPHIPAESRPPPPPPSGVLKSPSEGSESDDELSERPQNSVETPRGEAPPAARLPLLPPVAAAPPPVPTSPRAQLPKRTSYVGESMPSPTASMPSPSSKRNSRPPPPIPGAAPVLPPAQTRPPPPPPPPGPPSRTATSDSRLSQAPPFGHPDEEVDEEITEYEGDYDTDIASSVPHKDALKSHARESSFEDTASGRSPISELPPSMPPPIPASGPRAIPPPLPSQPPHDTRRSADMPRAAPPPPPPPKEAPIDFDDDYDPYNYNSPSQTTPVVGGFAPPQQNPEDTYFPPEPASRAPPPAPPANRTSARQSVDMSRGLAGRRSLDVSRPSMESGFVANDIDLAPHSGWYLQPKGLPPQLQGRKDIYFEAEESQSSRRGGRTSITKDLFVLFQDYSQTIITIRYDPRDSSDVQAEQRHEPPPRSLRQDQLEQAYERFGRQIAEAVTSKKDTVVADGTPQALILELLKPLQDALLPVGTRAYGALVYSNLANASTSQNDEIRPGDILSIRNAKFQGKHGPMHAKYNAEVGKPDHVGVVAEWDGTKKKVRAWEQGREGKKVKVESFKLDDLRSGEVKIWRVMPRSWVGWEGQN